VLNPLMVFPGQGGGCDVGRVAGVRTIIPVAFPPDVLNVLIVFDVTLDVDELPSTWMPIRMRDESS